MKKAYEYLERVESVEFIQSDDLFYRNSIVEELIKQVQIDTIKETVQECADNADADINWLNIPLAYNHEYEVYVIKDSILSIADKLIKKVK